MGAIKVNLDELAGCAMQFHTIAITLEDLKSSMDHVFGNVDSKIKRRRNIDGSIADIQKSMKALYTEIENISLFVSSSKDIYDKMETRLEKESNSFIDRMEDIAGLKKEWYQENWFKIAVGTVVTGIAIAAVVVAGPELMVISVCTVVGGGIGGITEGIESVQNGGTFIDGFSDGFMWGSIGGFASGAVIVSGAGLVASSYAGGAIDSAVYAGRCIQDGRTVTAEGVVGNFVTGAAVWAGGTLILGKVAKCAEEKLAKSVIDEVTTAGNPEIISKEAEEVIEGGSTSFEITPEIRTALKTEPNTAFFWSGNTEGVGGAEIAANIAKNKNGVTLESTIANKNIDIPKWDFDNPMSIKAWEDASAAYADQVSGEIRAVVGENLRPNNIWENVELPKLIGNENVCKITIIDPKTGIETIIYGGK